MFLIYLYLFIFEGRQIVLCVLTQNKQPISYEAQLAARLYMHTVWWPINPVNYRSDWHSCWFMIRAHQ